MLYPRFQWLRVYNLLSLNCIFQFKIRFLSLNFIISVKFQFSEIKWTYSTFCHRKLVWRWTIARRKLNTARFNRDFVWVKIKQPSNCTKTAISFGSRLYMNIKLRLISLPHCVCAPCKQTAFDWNGMVPFTVSHSYPLITCYLNKLCDQVSSLIYDFFVIMC